MVIKVWLIGAIVIFSIGVTNLLKGLISYKHEYAPYIEKLGYAVLVAAVIFTLISWNHQMYYNIFLDVLSAILILNGRRKLNK